MSEVIALKLRTVKTPDPADISVLSNENPSIIWPPKDTCIPASPAAPPDPPVNVKPDTSNWKPATGEPKSYKTSTVPAEASKVPNDTPAVKQDVPSPLQTSQLSKAAEPSHTPAQS